MTSETSALADPAWPEIDELMSNLYHEVDHEVAQRLRTEQVTARYPGWHFNAICWFEDGLFYAAVYVYHMLREVLSAETPEELMADVSAIYGYD